MQSLLDSQIAVMSSEERAYATIKSLILSGRYSKGDKLGYGELTKILEMSKTPVVSALSRLTAEGLVEHRQNSGYKVATIQGAAAGGAAGIDNGLIGGRMVTPPTGSLNQAVYEAIRQGILKSIYVPGQKLLYSDLEQRLGVSKTPIINALNRLESEGYVILKRNAGYYVREFTLKEVEDLFNARQAMELGNLDFALAMRTPKDLVDLEAIHREHMKHPASVYDETKLALNRRFHLRIAAMGRNSLMIKYITNLYDFFDLRMKFSFSFLPPERLKQIDVEHGEILAALREGNRTRLNKAFRVHLAAPVRDILKYLKDNQG